MVQQPYTPQPAPQQGQLLNVVLVDDMNVANNYPINPGASLLFLNTAMTEFKMRSRDANGFPGQERTWSLEETTPQISSGEFATQADIQNLDKRLDDIMRILSDFAK